VSRVVTGSTGMVVAHTLAKMDILGTPSEVAGTWVAGDKQEHMKASTGKQEVA
jgi:hypothetical protein